MKKMRYELIFLVFSALLSGCAKTEPVEAVKILKVTQEAETEQKTEILEQKETERIEETTIQGSMQEEGQSENIIDDTKETSYFNHIPDTDEFLSAMQETQDPGYILENSDSVYLTEEDISDFNKDKLKLARNEIFARHGMEFEDKILQSFFYTRSWYQGVEECEIKLNEFETINCELIQNREKQFEDGKIQSPEQDGWVFLEYQNNKYCYHGLEIDLSQTEYTDCYEARYLVRYDKNEFRLDSTWMRAIYKVIARTLEDGNVMILITGEDDTDNIYTLGYEVTSEGIKGMPSGAGVPIMCMDDYVCFLNCEDDFYGVKYYEWYCIDCHGKITRCMGAYDTGEQTWILNEPLEVIVVDDEGVDKKEILTVGEKISILSRLFDQKMWDKEEERALFLRIKTESTGGIVWYYWRENFIRNEETPLGRRCNQEKPDGFDSFRNGSLYRLYHHIELRKP